MEKANRITGRNNFLIIETFLICFFDKIILQLFKTILEKSFTWGKQTFFSFYLKR